MRLVPDATMGSAPCGGIRVHGAPPARIGDAPRPDTSGPADASPRSLFPEAEVRDESAVSLQICLLEVLEEPAPPSDHLEEPAPAVMIALVACKVVAQVVDPLGEKGDLDRRAPPVAVVELMPLDGCLAFGRFHARHGDVCSLRGVAVRNGTLAPTDPAGAGPRTRPVTFHSL